MAEAGKPTLTYFQIHAKGDFIRMALAKAGVDYNDQQLSFEEFGAMKAAGRFPAGSVPIWTTADGTIYNQCWAILKMIGRQNGLYDGSNIEESYIVDWVLETSADCQGAKVYMTQLMPSDDAAANEKATVDFKKFHDQISARLVAGKFIAGDRVTIADFVILSHYLNLAHNPDCAVEGVAARAAVADSNPEMLEYLGRVKAEIADWLVTRGKFVC